MTRHAPARPRYDLEGAVWRKSPRSDSGGNGQCLEAACVHDATWRKSARSSSSANGQCVEAAALPARVAIRDSKLDTTGDFPHLLLAPADWTGLLIEIRESRLPR
ncbi:MAG: DUF397 domain-containing protein [Stackebrandtia sp.]